MASALERVLVGKPIATSAEGVLRLTKLLALAASLRSRERTIVSTCTFRPDA